MRMLLIIAPATANTINKIAAGITDNMLLCVALAMWEKPLIIAPAMNTKMYLNPIVQTNLRLLKERGAILIEPKESMLACGTYGRGALADIQVIGSTVVTELRRLGKVK